MGKESSKVPGNNAPSNHQSGYGHVTPLTNSGKLFTIVYSILGIPFTLVFLTVSVQRLLSPTCSVLVYLFSRLGSSVDPFTIRWDKRQRILESEVMPQMTRVVLIQNLQVDPPDGDERDLRGCLHRRPLRRLRLRRARVELHRRRLLRLHLPHHHRTRRLHTRCVS